LPTSMAVITLLVPVLAGIQAWKTKVKINRYTIGFIYKYAME
jgi:hypothetical protein